MASIKQKKAHKKDKNFIEKREDLYVTQKQLDKVRGELKHDNAAVIENLNSFRKEVDSRFNKVDARFKEVDARFDKVDARFKEVDARFDKVESELSSVKSIVNSIDSKMDRVLSLVEQHHENQTVWAQQSILVERVDRIEKRQDEFDSFCEGLRHINKES